MPALLALVCYRTSDRASYYSAGLRTRSWLRRLDRTGHQHVVKCRRCLSPGCLRLCLTRSRRRRRDANTNTCAFGYGSNGAFPERGRQRRDYAARRIDCAGDMRRRRASASVAAESVCAWRRPSATSRAAVPTRRLRATGETLWASAERIAVVRWRAALRMAARAVRAPSRTTSAVVGIFQTPNRKAIGASTVRVRRIARCLAPAVRRAPMPCLLIRSTCSVLVSQAVAMEETSRPISAACSRRVATA